MRAREGLAKACKQRSNLPQRFGTNNTEGFPESELTMRSSLVDFAGLEGRERVRKAEREVAQLLVVFHFFV